MARRGPGLLGTMARTAVIAGTATAVSNSVSNKQQAAAQQKQAAAQQQAAQQAAAQQAQIEAAAQQAVAQQQAALDAQAAQLAQQQAALQAQQAAMAQPQQPAQVAAPAGGGLTDDTIAQLQKLADLQKAGILTPEEFAAQKAKILGM